MNSKGKITVNFVLFSVTVVLLAISRLVPHIQNFSPLCALGLFGAAYFDKKWTAYLIPILATFLSDLFLSRLVHSNEPFFYEGIQWVYLSYLIVVYFGFILFRKLSWMRIIAGSFIATLVFFLVTNAACWPGNPLYSQDINGFLQCMQAGIPFIKGTFYGNVFFTIVFLAGFYGYQRMYRMILNPSPNY